MNYTEAKEYLAQISKSGSVYGLDTMRELLSRLGNPQNTLKFLHISGTNGKGSVLAYLSAVLAEGGYRVGKYLSPAVTSYRETIQVDGKAVEKDAMAKHLTKIREVSEQMAREGVPTPTYFEVGTALAFLYFCEKQCDLVLLETGLGGAMDATNVVTTTILSVFTQIGLDHTDLLGDTITQIATEKAGIIKPNTLVVSAQQTEEAARVLKSVCDEKNCTLRFVENDAISVLQYGCEKQSFSYQDWENVEISMAGTYQMKNASLALEAIEALRELGFALSEEQVYDGLRSASWWGRFMKLASNPTVILDGAHNEDAAKELRRSLQQYYPDKRLIFIMGVLKDKDYQTVISLTAPLAQQIFTVETPNNLRALSAEALKEAVAAVNPSVEASPSIESAVQTALRLTGKDDVLVIFGSLSFLKEAERAVWKEVEHGATQ